MRPEVFVACTLPLLAQAQFEKRFAARFNEHGRTLTQAELLAGCGTVAGLVITATDPMPAATIAALPDSVRVLATYSVGHEHIDVAAARNRGIAVLSTPDVLSDSCADTAMLLMLGAARRVVEALELVRSGEWTGWTPLQLPGTDLYGRPPRYSRHGPDRPGRGAPGPRLRDGDSLPQPLPPTRRSGRGRQYHQSLADLLPHCDFLCVACPSTLETRGLIGAEAIAALPDGAVVANISRGDIIDDPALIAALRSGKVAAAGLDVFANEPLINMAYRTLPNVFGLPHIGSATIQTRVAMARLLAESMVALLAGEPVGNRLV